MGLKKIALLDAGAQLERVIMRRVMEQGYEVKKFPVTVQLRELAQYDAIILSGGPKSVYAADAPLPHKDIYRMGKPILGLCYGFQAMIHQNGGVVERGERGQYGRTIIDVVRPEGILHCLASRERVLMSHFDRGVKLPPGFEEYATSEGMPAVIGNAQKRQWGTQFHPELIPVTQHGREIFTNFFQRVCGFPSVEQRTIHDEIEVAQTIISSTLSQGSHVYHALSGGVDSMVMGALLARTVDRKRLHFCTWDTGAMRAGEISGAKDLARQLQFPNYTIVDATHHFAGTMREIDTNQGPQLAGPLWNTIDPETKRKLIGTEFAIRALTGMHEIAHQYTVPFEHIFYGQGSLRSDLIESASHQVAQTSTDIIKTHHNAVKILQQIRKIEPLQELFKDQVREMGIALGLPERFVYKQPCPGPNLYCRIVGARDASIPEGFAALDQRVHEHAKEYGFHAHVLPVKTVGVQGDERSYKHPVIVSGEVEWNAFAQFTRDLPNEIREINRVLYTMGAPVTREQAHSLTPTLMTRDVLQQIREADHIMREVAESYGFNDARVCSQMPGILTPCNFGMGEGRSFVVRPVQTHDFMALVGMTPSNGDGPLDDPSEYFPEKMLFDMNRAIRSRVSGISRVILDITDKPPGSTEWE